MSRTTQYPRWHVERDLGISVGLGAAGLTAISFKLTGGRREEFRIDFGGAGPGQAVGVNLQGQPVRNPTRVGGNLPNVSVGSDVLFAGRTRCADDFNGMGYILDLGGTVVWGASVQFLLFNLALSPFVLVQAGQALLRYANGEIRTVEQLPRLAPAFAVTAGALNVGGIAVGVTAYHGLWSIASEARTPSPSPPVAMQDHPHIDTPSGRRHF